MAAFGGGASTSAHTVVGGTGGVPADSLGLTRTTISDDAELTGTVVIVRAIVDNLRVDADSETDVDALGGFAGADSEATATTLTEVLVATGAEVQGNLSVQLRSEYVAVDMQPSASADCDCLFATTRTTPMRPSTRARR